jgi:quercetin dioxygenase-like cupin family protein
VRLVRFDAERGREIDRFGSAGFRLAPVAGLGDGRVACVYLAPGGRIGRHPAVGRQVLAVVGGSGTVCGADGVERSISAGLAAVWEQGQEHETRTDEGLTAIVVEGDRLDPLAEP